MQLEITTVRSKLRHRGNAEAQAIKQLPQQEADVSSFEAGGEEAVRASIPHSKSHECTYARRAAGAGAFAHAGGRR